MLPGAVGLATASGRGSRPAAPHAPFRRRNRADSRRVPGVDGDSPGRPPAIDTETRRGTRRERGPRVGSGRIGGDRNTP